MATLPDMQEATRRVWELIVTENAPGDLSQNVDLANEAAIHLIMEGGFDSEDSDVIFGGEMADVCQTLLAAAFMLQPQLATRLLGYADPDEPGALMDEGESAVPVSIKTPIQQAVSERLKNLWESAEPSHRQTSCRKCGLDIEGNDESGWRDRGGNKTCSVIGTHLPADEVDIASTDEKGDPGEPEYQS